jgi:predicted  nucleic acid-binding Zn-ribbon protein
MTTEQLTERIQKLQDEQNTLTVSHDRMVQQFQKTTAANQTRFAQLTGAIAELTDLKKSLNGASNG